MPRGELAPVAEPADVDEVCSRLLHTRHPRIVDEREGHTTLAEHLGEIGAEPAPVANLDSVARPLRQGRQEILEHPHPLYGEVRRKLEEQGAEPIFEGLHGVDEAFGLTADIDEVALMRHFLRKLSSQEKSTRRDIPPPLYGCPSGSAVEG